MKPATLGFVMPGMGAEYRDPHTQASLLALVALTGTTVVHRLGSHRRPGRPPGGHPAVGLMFIGTAICGPCPLSNGTWPYAS